jgi:hypothetical protein
MRGVWLKHHQPLRGKREKGALGHRRADQPAPQEGNTRLTLFTASPRTITLTRYGIIIHAGLNLYPQPLTVGVRDFKSSRRSGCQIRGVYTPAFLQGCAQLIAQSKTKQGYILLRHRTRDEPLTQR